VPQCVLVTASDHTSLLQGKATIKLNQNSNSSVLTLLQSHRTASSLDLLGPKLLKMNERVVYPGDAVIPDANMIYDQTITIPSRTHEQCFPWLLQLGCGRAGWYLPFWVEKWLIPESARASRTVRQRWMQLKVGDRVADYKMPLFDKEQPEFEVIEIDSDRDSEQRSLVYRSERYGAVFSWTLMARSVESPSGQGTVVHLRFRGKIAATGLKAKLIVRGGGWMDYLSTAPMLAGLRDRVLAMTKEHDS
jgi:hypothetical protein